MPLHPLPYDALTTTPHSTEIRAALPWIRSMPLSSVRGLEIEIDGAPPPSLSVALGAREIAPGALAAEHGWWFLQDRLVLRCPPVSAGSHRVVLRFELTVPYLPAGPDAPLTVPISGERDLLAGAGPLPPAARDAGEARP